MTYIPMAVRLSIEPLVTRAVDSEPVTISSNQQPRKKQFGEDMRTYHEPLIAQEAPHRSIIA